MAVQEDCRHYVMQTVRETERTERCRLGMNEAVPFACPPGCVLFEPRSTSSAGWHVSSAEAASAEQRSKGHPDRRPPDVEP